MERSDEEFRELIETHQEKVFRLVASILGPYREVEAEDVTQDVFLAAYGSWKRFRGESAAASWLYAIARNRALDRRKRARFRLPHLGSEAMEWVEGRGEDPVDRLAVAECLEALPEMYRTLLYLRYWQEASVEEIAEFTGLVPGTVKSYLARARAQVEARYRR